MEQTNRENCLNLWRKEYRFVRSISTTLSVHQEIVYSQAAKRTAQARRGKWTFPAKKKGEGGTRHRRHWATVASLCHRCSRMRISVKTVLSSIPKYFHTRPIHPYLLKKAVILYSWSALVANWAWSVHVVQDTISWLKAIKMICIRDLHWPPWDEHNRSLAKKEFCYPEFTFFLPITNHDNVSGSKLNLIEIYSLLRQCLLFLIFALIVIIILLANLHSVNVRFAVRGAARTLLGKYNTSHHIIKRHKPC